MTDKPNPPRVYREFAARFPKLERSWEMAREAEEEGPLDRKTARLIKLGVAAGALRRGAVRSAARKATAAGADRDEIFHVVALAASTIGMPSAVAVFSWLE